MSGEYGRPYFGVTSITKILIFGHLAQELLKLAAAFLAHAAFKLG